MKLPLLFISLAAYAAASVIDRVPLPLVTEAPTARAVSVEKRQAASLTATVTLSSNIGVPSHLASGFIYGIPDVAGQIPDSFYTGMVMLIIIDQVNNANNFHRDSTSPEQEARKSQHRVVDGYGVSPGLHWLNIFC